MNINSNGNGARKNNGARPAKYGNSVSNKKKMHPALKFFLIVFGMVFVFILIAGIGVMAYIANRTYEEARLPQTYADTTTSKPSVVNTVKKMFEKVPERTNFMIMGVDDEGGGIRSDTLLMGSFNSVTKKIYLVSVPRDVMISVPAEDIKEYNAMGIYPPSYMKFNEILAYIGAEYGIGATMKQLEHEFGVKLDYFVKIDTQGFRDLIDALGGVEMTLTRNYYYHDPDQNLTIDLKAGTQRLNGKAAEGLVRYRADYAAGDLKRIEVQQQFMGELFRQTLQRDNLVMHAPELLRVVLDNVTTNCTIAEASRYLQFVPALSSESLEMISLANDNAEGYRYGPDNLSYLRLDQAHVDETLDYVFFGVGETPPENSKELKMAVLNGSSVKGLAKKTSEMLTEKGYTVSQVGDFIGTKQDKDRVFVKKAGYGQDLKEIFKNCEVIVDKNNVPKGSDIALVLGTWNTEQETTEE